MNTKHIIIGVISVFVSLPISVYLQYKILEKIDASELMWFLFYVNIPFILLIQIMAKLSKPDEE